MMKVLFTMHDYLFNRLDLDGTHYKNYLSLGCCMEGLNIIVKSLFK